ncbi:MAG: sigma-E processing peptidase SpoIIGA [Clostridium sp.]|nr:sigma-E processing peptidase SpoIIGA [Clostridium sp.]
MPGISYLHKVLFGMIPVGGLMIKIACGTKGFRELLRAMGYLFTFSFIMGGFIIFLKGKSRALAGGGSGGNSDGNSVVILLGLGFAGYVLCRKIIGVWRRKRSGHFCRVILPGDAGPVEAVALVDTGNGLVEPVSGKPVAILDEERWKDLKMWMKPEKYKVIPYHSIGRDKGLMEGYEVNTMEVKGDEGEKRYDKVMIAVFKGKVSGDGSYQMILPPELSI